jgi:hypothetical protein
MLTETTDTRGDRPCIRCGGPCPYPSNMCQPCVHAPSKWDDDDPPIGGRPPYPVRWLELVKRSEDDDARRRDGRTGGKPTRN